MGLRVAQEFTSSDTIAEGYVISYTPMAKTRVGEGYQMDVTILISTGPDTPQATVTRFLNVPIEDAKAQITQLGLTVGKVDEYYSDEYAEGRVMWQSVNPGEQVDKGRAIDLWVSKGAEAPPEPTPSEEPEVSESPEPSDMPAEPTVDVGIPTSTQTITVNLDAYSGSVLVTIIVGQNTIFDNTVDANLNNVVSRTVSASGLQHVYVYIDRTLVESYPLDFRQ